MYVFSSFFQATKEGTFRTVCCGFEEESHRFYARKSKGGIISIYTTMKF